jgi:hypothetical protein
VKTYTKQQWWEECKKHKPDLAWYDFSARWDAIWILAQELGIAVHVNAMA